MFVARAVLPIEGLPAKMTKSDLCKPPNISSRAVSPVGTPTIPFSFFIANVAISMVWSKAWLNFKNDCEKLPLSAKSNNDFSVLSIILSAFCSLEFNVSEDRLSDIKINSLRKYISWTTFA